MDDHRAPDDAVAARSQADSGDRDLRLRQTVRVRPDISEVAGMPYCIFRPAVLAALRIEMATGTACVRRPAIAEFMNVQPVPGQNRQRVGWELTIIS